VWWLILTAAGSFGFGTALMMYAWVSHDVQVEKQGWIMINDHRYWIVSIPDTVPAGREDWSVFRPVDSP
jgi:hypothetical protein